MTRISEKERRCIRLYAQLGICNTKSEIRRYMEHPLRGEIRRTLVPAIRESLAHRR